MPIPLAREVLHFVEHYQYFALFVLLLLEEGGVPIPVPGDGLMMFAGYRAMAGHINFFLAFAVMEVATLIGASFLHWLGQWGGRPLVHRYGRYLRLDEKRLNQGQYWLNKHGPPAILLGRLIPGLRIGTSFVSGVFEVPYRVFLPYVAIGSSLYILFFMAVGLGLGGETRRIIRFLLPHPFALVAVGLLLVAAAVLAVWLRARLRSWEE